MIPPKVCFPGMIFDTLLWRVIYCNITIFVIFTKIVLDNKFRNIVGSELTFCFLCFSETFTSSSTSEHTDCINGMMIIILSVFIFWGLLAWKLGIGHKDIFQSTLFTAMTSFPLLPGWKHILYNSDTSVVYHGLDCDGAQGLLSWGIFSTTELPDIKCNLFSSVLVTNIASKLNFSFTVNLLLVSRFIYDCHTLYSLCIKYDFKFDHSNKTCWAVLFCGAVYCAVQGDSNFCGCGWNPKVWPLEWKLLSSTFLWCCLLCCTRWF